MAEPEKPALISAHDIGFSIGVPFLAATAWLTPERHWPFLARKVAPFAGPVVSRSQKDIIACVEKTAKGWDIAQTPETIAQELVAAEIIRNFQTMRDHLPWRWHPNIELIGREHIDAALEKGHGVILWDSHFYYAFVLTKMAFARAGYDLVHLSHPRHGRSSTRFGMRFLNPIQTSVEARYLKERLVMSLDGSVAALRTLVKRLKSNAVTSITVRDTGQAPCQVPFMAGQMKIATGAPDLAYKCGAALIPVFTILEEGGLCRVIAEEPITIQSDISRQDAAVASAKAYAKRLEHHVARYPGQWVGWLNI